MELTTALATGKSLLDLAKDIAALIEQADKTVEITQRISLYLESAEGAVAALGLERQRILTDLRKLDIGKPEQVNAAWERLDKYLHEDNVRPSWKRRSRVSAGAAQLSRVKPRACAGASLTKRPRSRSSPSFHRTFTRA